MFSVRWESGLLRGLGQSLATVLVASTIIFLPINSEPASATSDTFSEVDYYLDLNGTNQAAYGLGNSSAVNLGSSDWTVEAWIKPAALPGTLPLNDERMILNKELSYEFAIFNGTYHYALMPEDINFTWQYRDTGIAPLPDQWQHVAFAKSGNTLQFFLNGFEVYTVNDATKVPTSIRSSNLILSLGARESTTTGSVPTGAWMDGGIDEVRIWNERRTSGQIVTAMHQKLDGTQANLLAYWDFNEGSGATVLDRGPNNLDLTLHNSPTRADVKEVSAASDGDTVITFPRTYLPGVGGWTVPSAVDNFQAVVVGGGGGGGGGGFHRNSPAGGGGGGAAGQLTQSMNVGLSADTTVSIIVGLGGVGGKASPGDSDWAGAEGTSGMASQFGQLQALGGERGWGGYKTSNGTGTGRHAINWNDGAGGQGGSGSPFNAFVGGLGYVNVSNPNDSNGPGGGGAGSTGSGADATATTAGAGGPGTVVNGQTYATGGTGGDRGGVSTPTFSATSTPNTGNGGVGGRGCLSGGGVIGSVCSGGQAGASGAAGSVQVRFTPIKDFAWSKSASSQNYAVTNAQVVPASGSWTFEAWVYPDAIALSGTQIYGIFTQQNDNDLEGNRAGLWVQAGAIGYNYGGTDYTRSQQVMRESRWYHVALAVTANSQKVFVDGQLFHSSSYAEQTIGGNFVLGGLRQSNFLEWPGQLDQVKVWQGELSGSQIQTSMHTYSSSGVTGPTLLAHYDFNEHQDGLVIDRSGNNKHLLFNTAVAGSYAPTDFTDSQIVESGSPSSSQRYLKFNRSYLTAAGGWSPLVGVSSYQALVVGGGGGGGAWVGGGGGAGGFSESQNLSLNSVTRIKVGQGGLAAVFEPGIFNSAGFELKPSNGQDSSIGDQLSVLGGGFGGSHTGNSVLTGVTAPSSGASGGGGTGKGGNSTYNTAYLGASGTVGQGSSGGSGSSTAYVGGGGGGAGQAGLSATTTAGGNGGEGIASSITGTSTFYAGGGGGGRYGNSSGQGLGGQGGGGTAGFDTTPGGSGVSGLGGGGGGGASSGTTRSQGGHGGSGVVILAYSLAPDAPSSLSATQSTSHATIYLSWTAPTYTGNSAITDYDIEYKPAGGSWTSYSDGVSSATTRAVELPTQCVAHEFRVIAKNASFGSVASATASATPVWGTFGSLTGVQIGSTNSECVVKFTSTTSNTWAPPFGTDTVQALVVAGGGGGGGSHGGGGGAGGLAYSPALPVTGVLNVQVGAGGEGFSQSGIVTCNYKYSYRGGDSRLGSISVAGGGAGSNGCNGTQNTTGGSGGGASYPSNQAANNRGSSSLSPSTSTVFYFGNPGGFGRLSNDLDDDLWLGGGGGGAGSPGFEAVGTTAGTGGSGFISSISGTLVCYAAGGGGGSGTAQSGQGGAAGGCAGLTPPGGSGGRGMTPGSVAALNSGSGGGGGGYTDSVHDFAYPAGDGAAGIVIIRQLSVALPTITIQPQNLSAEPGQTKTLTVTATGNGTLSYQWQSSTDGTNWTNVGTNAASLTTPVLTLSNDGIRYRVGVTNTLNGQTSTVTSSEAVITVTGVSITAGACTAMVGSDAGVTISETANGGCLVEYTTPGSNTFFVPNQVSSLQAFIVGGGGGGGGAKLDQGGGGGGGGAASRVVTLAVTGSQVLPVTVGAGGAGGNAEFNGSNGGSTSISSSFVVAGGNGGKTPPGWPPGGGQGGSGASTNLATSGASGGAGATDPGDRSYYQPRFGNAGSNRIFAGEYWCVGGGAGGGNREVANDAYFHWEPRSQFCSDGTSKPGGSGGWHNGTTNVLPTSGEANRGGGGGGGSYDSSLRIARAGAAGADGVVAIYYVQATGEISLSTVAAVSFSDTTHAITLTKDNNTTDVTWTTSNTAVCTIASSNSTGATIQEEAAGLCEVSVVVAANQAQSYGRGTAATSFQIDKISRSTPTWSNGVTSVSVPFGSSLDLRPRLSQPGESYTFSTSGTVGSCSVTGYTLNVGNVGDTCNVTPTLLGNAIYLDMVGATALSVTVTKISQSALVLTSGNTMNVNQTLTLSAAGGSGTGAISYQVASQGGTGCVADPTTGALTATAAGSCEVYAQRAGSTNYDPVTSSHVVVTINKVSQNLSWLSQPQAQYLAGQTYALEATASSQLTVAYSISAGLCTIAGTTVTFTGSGDCVILAGQSGDHSYLPAVTISQTVSVGKINQTMTFSALANVSWGSLAFSLSATASSGLNIVYSENNQTTNDACDVSANGIVTIKNVGTCAITATQAGNSAYTAVTTTRLFEVTANQAGAPFIGSVSFGDRQLNASFFTPSYLGGGNVSAYQMIAYKLDGTVAATNSGCIASHGPTQSCSVIGLENGVKYVLKVAAITEAGLGSYSASSSEIIPASNPEAVGNLLAIEGNGQLSLQWTQPTSFGGGSFFQYRIYWRAPGQQYQADGSPGATVGTQASTSYVITGLTNGIAYDVKIVTATSNNNVELQSNTAEVRQTPFTVPDAPAAVVALDNNNNVVVAWQPPVFDGGNPIDQYVVTKGNSTVCTITSATTTSCEVTRPAPGSTEVIQVRAGNDAGLSAPASTSITIQAVQGSSTPIVGGGGVSLPGITPNTPAPIVLDVSGSAVVKTNQVVRLVGTNFNLVEKVLVGNTEASFFVNTAELITIRIPIEVAAGKPVITLQGAFGSRIFANLIEVSVTQVSIDTKVTIGTFLGFAAVYTKNHEGKRLSMKIGSKWRVIESLGSDYTYNFTKVGKGKTVTVTVYLDRQLVQVKQIKIQ